ncbi:heme exporter protein CcmB [Jannaschia sp. W003]|uniref:heme exporter protein CcmB n=1 Tax=Jannaschia sp. W003 TaxID=2867012 RepID=UPI0021A91BC3|nr:heme exporter protein CcmB [Jannaschia sp. W003]UWQ20980.1 heme exporter protein CcmB [Jannaschia sp. W003]
MLALLLRDLRLALRSGGGFGLGLVFFALFATLAALGAGPSERVLAPLAPGALWLGALLACLLSLDRLFALDLEDGSLEALIVAPLPAEAVAAAKALAHWIATGLPLVAASPALALVLYLPAPAVPWLVASLLLGTPALSAIGTFGAALTVGLKRGTLLLGLLVLPLYIPTLVFGAETVRRAAAGLDPSTPLALLAAITLGSAALLPFAAAAALRVALR